jgi:hypothetical protein
MRGLPVRRIASTALCATLALGIAAPTALAADGDAARERTHAVSRAPVPGVDALLNQVSGLGHLGTVLTPVTDLLNTVLKADNGRLTPEQATQLGNAVKEALAKIAAAAPATSSVTAPTGTTTSTTTGTSTTTSTDVTSTPPAGTTLPTGTLPALTKSAHDGRAKAAAADPVDDALAVLQKAVAALLAAATSGDVGQIVPAATGVVTGVVGLLAATLENAGLTLPSLPGLPASPPATGGLLPTG